jgi:sulfur relay (sulfurtransferase) DsrC/TusE family protein
MKDKIETIIIGTLFGDDANEELFVSSFLSCIKLTLQGRDIFTLVPETVYVSNEKFKESETLAGSNVGLAKDLIDDKHRENKDFVEYFPEKGTLLFDGLHASAFGKMNYIYRTKGIRIYLFKNSEIHIVTPYCTIDHDGFQLKQEVVASYRLSEITTKKDVIEIINYTRDDFNTPFTNSLALQTIIRLITNVKKIFRRDYYLEYLLTPPDVDLISDFSKKIHFEMWNVCLSKKFAKNWGNELQDQAINLLSTLEITLSPGQLIKFIKNSSTKKDTEKILERLNRLENNINDTIKCPEKKDPIIEFKPNISGIGINGNEAFKRLKQIWKSKK